MEQTNNTEFKVLEIHQHILKLAINAPSICY